MLEPGVCLLPAEVEVGCVEYKLKLIDPSASRLEQLVTQLKYRLAEGAGRATYLLGVGDDGTLHGLAPAEMDESIGTLRRMCAHASASMTSLHERPVGTAGALVAEVAVEALAECAQLELRLAMLGAAQAGKSTLVGVLAGGPSSLDDGKGSARTLVMRHMHELETGATSCVSQRVLGFDSDSQLLNWTDEFARTPAELCEASARLLTLLDLCGHDRYLKTTLTGLTAHAPGAAVLCVGADVGITSTTSLHAALAAALGLPVVGLVCKADLVDEPALRQAEDSLIRLLREHGFPAPTLVRNDDDLASAELPLPAPLPVFARPQPSHDRPARALLAPQADRCTRAVGGVECGCWVGAQPRGDRGRWSAGPVTSAEPRADASDETAPAAAQPEEQEPGQRPSCGSITGPSVATSCTGRSAALTTSDHPPAAKREPAAARAGEPSQTPASGADAGEAGCSDGSGDGQANLSPTGLASAATKPGYSGSTPGYSGSTGCSRPSTPVLTLSACTGAGLPLLIRLLGRLPIRDPSDLQAGPLMLSVDGCHEPALAQPLLHENDPAAATSPGRVHKGDGRPVPAGPVISGTLLRGCLHATGRAGRPALAPRLPQRPGAMWQAAGAEAARQARQAAHGLAAPNGGAVNGATAAVEGGAVKGGAAAAGQAHAPPPHHASLANGRCPPERLAGLPKSCCGPSTPAASPAAARRPPPAAESRSVLLGPDAHGQWLAAEVPSIMYKELAIRRASAGQSATFSLHVAGDAARLRRGMVLIDACHPIPLACWEFEASVKAIQLTTELATGTQLVLYSLGVKQAVKLLPPPHAQSEPGHTQGGRRVAHAECTRGGGTGGGGARGGTGGAGRGVGRDGARGGGGVVGSGRSGALGARDGSELRQSYTRRLRFRFVHSAEFLLPGAACILRRGSAAAPDLGIAVGRVVELGAFLDPPAFGNGHAGVRI